MALFVLGALVLFTGLVYRAYARTRKARRFEHQRVEGALFEVNDPDAVDAAVAIIDLLRARGDAAGSLTATRDVQTQAVFALKGKPLNTYGLSKKVIYENEEFHLLQSALNIEEGMDGLRYNKIVIAIQDKVFPNKNIQTSLRWKSKDSLKCFYREYLFV
mgnify:CR=1 FL=1